MYTIYVSIYIYIYIYIYTHTYIGVYIYAYSYSFAYFNKLVVLFRTISVKLPFFRMQNFIRVCNNSRKANADITL